MTMAFQAVRSRLLYKMLITYSLLTIVPLFVVSLTYYLSTKNLVEKKATENAQQELSAVSDRIDNILYTASKHLIGIAEQPIIASFLETPSSRPAVGSATERNTLEKAVLDLLQSELDVARRDTNSIVQDIYVMDLHAHLYGTDSVRGLEYKDAVKLLPFQYDRMPQWAFFTDEGRLSCEMKIFSSATGAIVGYLILVLDPVRLASTYSAFPKGMFFITDTDNLIVSASDRSKIGDVLDIRGPANLLEMKQRSRYADFVFVRFDKPGTGGVVARQARFTILVMLLSWIVVSMVTYLVLRKITVPLRRLTSLMRKAEREEYELMGPVDSHDEISVLCEGFDQLVVRTRVLIERNYKAELLKKQAELNAIRMYVNPHFLYNTLEFISVMSQTPATSRSIPEMVRSLAEIFRFSIAPGDAFIPLQQEVEFAKRYLRIHEFRFRERLRYQFSVDSALNMAAVPKLILQPLIENAVVHGIDRLSSGGEILTRITEEDYLIVVRIVNDSAEGSSDSHNGTPTEIRGLGSGLDYVNTRIRYHFGDGYGAEIHQASGRMTVTVKMPITIYEQEAR